MKKPKDLVLKERLLAALVKKEGIINRAIKRGESPQPLSAKEKNLMEEYRLEICRYAITLHPRR
jgi:hypothetical protein